MKASLSCVYRRYWQPTDTNQSKCHYPRNFSLCLLNSPLSCICRLYRQSVDTDNNQNLSPFNSCVGQAQNREVLEFVCHVDDVVAAHHRVTGMNFIPGGYTMPTSVWEACAEAESQIVASGAVESETELPSPLDEDIFLDT